jgi:hypothetical protein
MATRTQEFWAVADHYEWKHKAGEFDIRLTTFDPAGLPEYTLIRAEPYAITIEIPDGFDIRTGQAEAIRCEIEMVRANAQNRITELTAKLNSILAIEG